MDSRLSELTSAVDAGDFRQALRLANQQLLRVQKQLHGDPAIQLQQQCIIKSIKVIILVRQGKTDEALELLRQLPRDDAELNWYLCIAYKELRNGNRLAPCRVASLPTLSLAEARNEVKTLEIFNTLDANHDRFQEILRLYGTYRKPRYLLWTIVAAIMSTRHPNGRKRLHLAQQLLRQLPLPNSPSDLTPPRMQDPKVNIQLRDANATLMVHISVLRQSNKIDDALDLLSRYENCCLHPGEFSALRIQLLAECGKIDRALKEAEDALADPEIEAEFWGAFVRLAAAQGEEATAKAFEKLRCINGFPAAAAALELLLQRGLELVDGHDRLLSDSGFEALWKAVEHHGNPVEGLFHLLKNYASDYSAFRFFRDYAGRFNIRQRLQLRSLLLDLRPGLFAAAQQPGASPGDIRRLLTIDKSLLALGEWMHKNASSAQRIVEWRQLFTQHCARSRMECLMAELIGLSVEIFLRWDRESEDARPEDGRQEKDPWNRRRFLFEALAWINAGLYTEGLRHSPLLHQTRCALGFVMGDMFAINESFAAMDVKQSLLLSLALYQTSAQADYGLLGHLGRFCRILNETREDIVEAYGDYLSSAVEEGSFSWIPEYRLSALMIQHSLDMALVTLQEVLFQICERNGRGSAELLMLSPLISSPLPDRLGASALRSAGLCREPFEWWLTAAALNSPASDPSLGAFAPLTSCELGLSCISTTQPDVLFGRELSHPIRRALQLHKSRQTLNLSVSERTDEAAAVHPDPVPTSGQGDSSEIELMEAAINEEERALFAFWQAGMHPKIWRSAWPSRLLGAEATHLLSRYHFFKGPPRPIARRHGTSLERNGRLYRAWFSRCEYEALEALEGSWADSSLEPSRESSYEKRSDEEEPDVQSLPQGSPYAEPYCEPYGVCCASQTCAARRAVSPEPATGYFTPYDTPTEDSTVRDAASVTYGATGALNELVGSLRRSIPSRIRRLRLLFAVARPSAEMDAEQVQAIQRLLAELRQVLQGPRCGCGRTAWPTASSRHTDPLGTSNCTSSSCRMLEALYSHQCAALTVFKAAFELSRDPEETKTNSPSEETARVTNQLCEALDGCREFLMACCTSVLDSIGELKGLGRPPLAEAAAGVRFAVFDALFGLSQVSTVSLLLVLIVCQQLRLWNHALSRTKGIETTPFSVVMADARPSLDAFINCMRGQHKSLVDAMDTASQLESIGCPPWLESTDRLSYGHAGDTLMEEARQRVRAGLCSSYIETTFAICRVMETRVDAIADCLQLARIP